jgi:hypothetical protein
MEDQDPMAWFKTEPPVRQDNRHSLSVETNREQDLKDLTVRQVPVEHPLNSSKVRDLMGIEQVIKDPVPVREPASVVHIIPEDMISLIKMRTMLRHMQTGGTVREALSHREVMTERHSINRF